MGRSLFLLAVAGALLCASALATADNNQRDPNVPASVAVKHLKEAVAVTNILSDGRPLRQTEKAVKQLDSGCGRLTRSLSSRKLMTNAANVGQARQHILSALALLNMPTPDVVKARAHLELALRLLS
jgi:hypothetical protein